MVNQFKGSQTVPPQFTRGYGLVFGQAERKAMSMSLVDRALRAREFGEDLRGIAQDEEFVISHCDNVQATGFVERQVARWSKQYETDVEAGRSPTMEGWWPG